MKPVLLGMNQPIEDAEPLDARIPRSAGWNLWRMTHNVCGLTAEEWMEAFDRRNVLAGRDWSAAEARAAALEARRALAGRAVVVLGRAPAAALGLPWLQHGVWRWEATEDSTFGFKYACIPHPSGRCRDYNDTAVRLATGRLLAELIGRPSGG